MKKLCIVMLTLLCAASVFAQGYVVFNNRVVGSVITHVYLGGPIQIVGNGPNEYSDTAKTPGTNNWSGWLMASGSDFCAQLLAAPGSGQPESALVAATPVTTFRTGSAAGFVNATTAILNNIPADYSGVATVEMVAWYNPGGLYPTWAAASAAADQGLTFVGRSGTFELDPVGGLNPALDLNGLQSFNIVGIPEPSAVAMLGLCGAGLWISRRVKKHFPKMC